MAARHALVHEGTNIMKAHRIGTAVLAACLAFPHAAVAHQALVRSYDDPALEIGQAYLAHFGDRCLAILPMHVADEAGDMAALLGEGRTPLLGEAAGYTDLGDDIAIADVAGGLRQDCGYSIVAISRAVNTHIRANAIAGIRSVNADGSIAQLSVAIIDDDGGEFLRVQPTHATNQLVKGQSGSLLLAGDTPIGMLLSVDSRFGVGKVIRLDRLLEKVERRLGNSAPLAPAAAMRGATAPVAADAGAAITGWSALPIDATHRAANLVASDDAPPWIADVDAWPVEIELELLGGRTTITGIELDGRGIEDPGVLPAVVEIMISATGEGRRWRSVAGGPIAFEDGVARVSIAPSWARHVRLAISAPADGGRRVGLGRLRVIESR
ncbi:discoidin domain-containing protein [Thiococcus pfennigii]|uniref:discoidin domain-containing protein n=1 Tax=Thiococcus pfennigii TaxID=1057 RepID=UPI001902EF8A|nr:discoidin domain-containing protein [Thiococcus pfennigii]